VSFKLLYRGSRDGWSQDNMLDKTKSAKGTIRLVRSKDRVFGGYTTEPSGKDTKMLTDDTAFLFSITHKEKYPVKKGQTAYYNAAGYIAVFGNGGSDLYIQENKGANTGSGQFGQCYDKKGKTPEHFTGTTMFAVEEFETFQVITR